MHTHSSGPRRFLSRYAAALTRTLVVSHTILYSLTPKNAFRAFPLVLTYTLLSARRYHSALCVIAIGARANWVILAGARDDIKHLLLKPCDAQLYIAKA